MGRMMFRCLLAPVCAAVLIPFGWAQGPSRHETDNPAARSAWFQKGRQSPDQQPAAAHRLQAVRQALRLSIARPTSSLLNAAPGTTGGAWTELGPRPQLENSYGDVSGRVTSIALDLTHDPTGNTVYVGSAYGGVWESTNALAANPVFTPISDISQSLAVGAIGLDTTTSPATIYVGTGEANYSGDSYYGVGILKSTDGGQSWSLVSSANSGTYSFMGGSFSKILVDPTNHLKVLAAFASASHGNGLAALTYGVYLSTDGGQSWTLALNTGSNSVDDMAYDAQNKVYYAAVEGTGIYKSSDGITWTLTTSPLAGGVAPTSNNFKRASLATRGGVVYALIVDSNGGFSTPSASDTGIVQSADGGTTWTPIANPGDSSFFGPASGQQGWYDQYIAAPPAATGLVIAGIDVWTTSTVSGATTTWTNTTQAYSGGSVHPDEHAIAMVNGTTWFIGNDGGVWDTTTSGTAWINDNASMGNIQFTSVTPDDANAGTWFGGSQDNGTAAGSSTAKPWSSIFGGDGGFTDTDPNSPAEYFTETTNVDLERSDNSGGTFQTVVDGTTIADSSAFYVPYQVMPGWTSEVLLGTCRVWMGPAVPAASGSGWAPISPDLSTGGAGNGCNSNSSGNILAIASAPSNPAVVYAVTDDGVVQRSTNATSTTPTWTNLTVAPLPTGNYLPFSSVAVSPTDPNTAYVGVMGFGGGHVFKTSDGGQSWLDITGNLPDAPVNSILIDPQNLNDVYVASDVGVFVAIDGGVTGETWQRMGSGLPDTAIVQLKLSQVGVRVLVAATHGRGAWETSPLTNTPDFTLQATPEVQTLQGTNPGTVTVTAGTVNAYSGTLTLSCTTPATGCSFSPATIQAGGTGSTLTVSPSAITADGTPVTISATDGTLTHTDTVLMNRPFALTISPASGTTIVGGMVTETVTGSSIPGTETLACSGLPAGATCSFSPAALTSTATQSTLTVNVPTSTPYNNAAVTVTGSDGTNTASASFNLTVTTFSLQATTTTATAYGSTGTASFSVLNDSPAATPASVTLNCTGLPAGATCSFNPATVSGNQNSTVTVSNVGSPAGGSFNFTLTGTSGVETETLPLTVSVEDFTLAAQGTTAYRNGDTAMFVITPSAVNGLTSSIAMSCPNLAAGLACSFSPASVTPGQSTTLTVSGLAAVTALPVNLNAQGTVSGDTHTLALTIQSGPFQVTPTAATVGTTAGDSTAVFSLNTATNTGSNQTLTFSCTGLPAGATCAFSPATVTTGATTQLTVSGLASQAAGNLAFQAVASNGTASIDTPLTIAVGSFTLSAASSSVTTNASNNTAAFTVNEAAVNGFTGSTALACTGLPAGASCSFNPASITPGQASTLTVSGLTSLTSDTLTFNATGTSASDVQTLTLTVLLQDFTLSAPTSSASILAGTATASLSATATAVNGFASPLTLGCSGLPTGATCTFTPATINPGQTATVAVAGLAGQAGGVLNFNLTATAGALSHSTPVTVNIQDFDLSAVTTLAGTSGSDTTTFNLTTQSLAGFNQAITLACSGQPAGVTCAFNPASPTPGQAVVLTLSGLSKVTPQTTFNFNVTGTAAGLTHTLGLSVTYADFTVTPSASTLSVAQGTASGTVTLATAALNNFNGTITFACSGLPAGASCSFAPTAVTAGQSTVLTLSGLAALPAASSAITVTAASAALQHTVPLTLSIGDFSLNTTASTASVSVGTDTATFTIQSAAVNQFGGSVTLACSGLPQGASCAFSPASVTPGQSTTLTVSGLNTLAAQADDAFNFTMTGTSGADQKSLPLSVAIADVAASLPTGGSLTQSVTAGQTASFSLNYSGVNGFSGAVAMSCSGVPLLTTCSVSPASFNLAAGASQAVTVTVSTTAAGLVPPVGPQAPAGPTSRWPLVLLVLGMLLAVLGLRLVPMPRRLRPALLTTALLLASALLLAGCGGGGGGSTPTVTPGTSAGTTVFSVTATVNGVQHTQKLTLTVN